VQKFILVIFIFVNLYVFRPPVCPSSGETTVFMRHLAFVFLKQLISLNPPDGLSYNTGC